MTIPQVDTDEVSRALRRESSGSGQRTSVIATIATWAAALIGAFPLVWIAIQSVRPDLDILTMPWGLPDLTTLDFGTYAEAFFGARMGQYLINSGIVVAAVVALAITLATLGGYALSRLQFAGKSVLAGLIYVALIVPSSILLLPMFLVAYQLGLLDTRLGLIIPYTAFTIPLTTILMRRAFDAIPKDLFDAARIDGARELTVFWRIAFPLVPGMIATIGFLIFMPVWEEYLWAFSIVRSDDMFTVPLGLTLLNADRAQYGYNVGFASMVIAASPVIIALALAQRRFFAAITAGAVKG